jgi:CRP-like cAMP-binding protein
MTDREFGELAARFRPRTLRKRGFLYRQGQVCGVVGFVNRGCLRNFHLEEDGEEYIVNFPREDWWVADLQSFYLEIPSMFSMQALEDCDLLWTTKAEFEWVLANLAPFQTFYHAKIGRAYTANTLRIATNRSATAEERYADIVKNQPWMLDRIPQRHLASYLGIKPQSLSRIRKAFRESSPM